jgi:L-methionine (R)-S-oxide reductase
VADALILPENTDKAEIYAALLPQIDAVTRDVDDLIANLANMSAILKQAFDFHWVGFYRTISPGQLILGPFQGPLACVSIPFSRGVCGAAATQRRTIIVPNVEEFPGHIACSSLSKSEIVIPLVHDGETRLLLDVDSDRLDDFDQIDRDYLEGVVDLVKLRHFN